MMFTPSGSAITWEVLVALSTFEVSVALSDFAVPVNVLEVIVELELAGASEATTGTAAGAAAATGN